MPQGINTGEILEALNDKMDRDGHNVQSPTAFIVETYDDGNGNGYILYSNSWCKQYGTFVSAYTVYTSKTINLLKQFADTNYCITYNTASTNQAYVAVISDKTTTSFTLINTVNYNGYATWKAEGYIS